MNFTKRAKFLIENLNLPQAAGVEDARWEYFQLQHLNDNSIFRIENKSRQIAWSFTVAAEAMATAILDGQSSLFTSVNLDEAAEKIRYARAVYDNLQIGGLPKIKLHCSVLAIQALHKAIRDYQSKTKKADNK